MASGESLLSASQRVYFSLQMFLRHKKKLYRWIQLSLPYQCLILSTFSFTTRILAILAAALRKDWMSEKGTSAHASMGSFGVQSCKQQCSPNNDIDWAPNSSQDIPQFNFYFGLSVQAQTLVSLGSKLSILIKFLFWTIYTLVGNKNIILIFFLLRTTYTQRRFWECKGISRKEFPAQWWR